MGTIIAQRYRVVASIGKGSFSRVVQCLDLHEKMMVSVKVLRNDKDCMDQGLGEVRLLALIGQHDARGEQPLLSMLDYFYYKEHLLIVTELLRDSVFNFYRYRGCEGLRGGCPAAECAARAPARVFAAEGAALKEELFIPRNGLPASRDPAHLFFSAMLCVVPLGSPQPAHRIDSGSRQ